MADAAVETFECLNGGLQLRHAVNGRGVGRDIAAGRGCGGGAERGVGSVIQENFFDVHGRVLPSR